MINLLPYENKKQLRAARHNVILAKCMIFLMSGILFLTIACFGAYSLLRPGKSSGSAATDKESLSIISQANDIKSDIALSKNILNKHVKYSDIILELAGSLPSGVIISNLSINSTSLMSPIQLTLQAVSEEKAQETKNNLNKSAMFSKASIISVTSDTTNSQPGYPATISLMVTIDKVNKL